MGETKLAGFWLIIVAIIASYWPASTSAQQDIVNNAQQGILTIPVAVFVVDVVDDVNGMSSQRTVQSMGRHFQQVNRVWSQAGIQIDPVTVRRISVPENLLQGLIHGRGRGGIARFFRAIRHGEVDVGNINNELIWTFFVRSLGGPNGLKPNGVNSLFVVDNPLNSDYRVTSHEIGHILGLHHTRYNVNTLLFPGSNGLRLNEAEKTVARYNAERILR